MTLLFRFLVFVFVSVAAIYFAVLNRVDTSFTWSPFDPPLTTPVFLIGLGGASIGFICGTLYMWFNYSQLRHEKRQQKKEINNLKKELETERKDRQNKAGDADTKALPTD